MRRALSAMALALGACQTLPTPETVRASIANDAVHGHAIDGVPFVAQEPYGCGPAALESVASHYGVAIPAGALETAEVIPSDYGTTTYALAMASRRAGLFARDIRFVCDANPSPLRRVLTLLDADVPVLVLVRQGLPLFESSHYIVLTGYDDSNGYVLYQDGVNADAVLDYGTFQDIWHDGGHWGLIAFPPDREFEFLTVEDRLELAQLCESQRSWRAAARHYDAVLRERPDDVNALLGRAGVLSQLGANAEAARTFERALEIDPVNPRILNNYAQHVVRSRGDLALAEALVLRIRVEGAELKPFVYDTYGQVLAAQGNHEAARIAFRVALASCTAHQAGLEARIRERLDATAR